MKVGDYTCWTVFAGEKIRHDPVWGRILSINTKKEFGCLYGTVRIMYSPPNITRVGSEFRTNLYGWGEDKAVVSVISEQDLPDEFFTQMAKQALLA
jgi:hypothetical protein